MRLADEAAAENDVGLAFDDRLEQLRVIVGVVFQIGILHQHDVAGGKGEAVAQRGTFAFIDGLMPDGERGARELCRQLIQPGGGVVFGAVVDADDLPLHPGRQRGIDDAADQFLNGRAFVVNRNDDRKLHSPGSVRICTRACQRMTFRSEMRWPIACAKPP